MDLDQVIELVRDALIRNGITGLNALRGDVLIDLVRETWIEHLALPDLPVTHIIDRRLGNGFPRQTEYEFWARHGLRASDFSEMK